MEMRNTHIEVSPLAGALGAEVGGVDLSRPLPEEVHGEVLDALHEHVVIFFRDQELDCAQHQAFASNFGPPIEHPFTRGLDEWPETIEIIRSPGEDYNWDSKFHSDLMFLEAPPMGASLYALEIPPYGGDTLFVNMYLAYETLSEKMKEVLSGLRGVNESGPPSGYSTPGAMAGKQGEPMSASHPVVRTHPVTGRKALFVSPGFTRRIEGMTEDESRPLIEFLCSHALRPEFSCRFRWSAGAVAVWDNRVSLHRAVPDFFGEVDNYRRVMHRVTIGGDRPI
jgi:taurine dioxygenase